MAISTDSALPENRVKISEDLRSMNVPTGEQVLGCVGDAWVRRVWFDMPRYCDGTDLSGYTLSVNYRNTDEDEDRYPVSDAVVNADTITFSWLVGAVACAAPGLTSVSIKAQKLNDDTVEKEFNSTIYYFKVLPANTTGAEPLQEYSDAFTTLMLQWQAEVDEAVAEAPKGKLVGTASGTTPQTVNDAWPTTPESAKLYGKSVQDGTPTPENPVPVQVVGGKNLMETTFTGSVTSSGVTATKNNDGSITLSGTASGVGTWILAGANPFTDTIFTLAPGTYTLSLGGAFSQSCTLTLFDLVNNKTIAAINGTDAKKTFTLTETANVTYVRFQVYSWTYDHTIYPQLEAGTHATPYTPYGCIGLQIGENITPIDLQGHTLAGLPNGTRDELDIDATGVVSITQNVGYIASYDGESVGDIYISTTGQLTTGASVYYKLDTPQTIELGTITPPDIAPGDTLAIYASLDPEWQIEYEQDPNIVVNALQSSIAPVEGSTASANYAVNSYLIHANQLYRVTSAIATGEAITPNTNCVACTVMGEVIRLTA